MKKIKLYLVKTSPCSTIVKGLCPVPEKNKYSWEPVVLKLIAYYLERSFSDLIDIEIWHLITEEDYIKFNKCVLADKPDIVAFTEIDVLVNTVNKVAEYIKTISPNTITIVGGKQSSLLREGDKIPFIGIDYIIRGDGVNSMLKIVDCILRKEDVKFEWLIDAREHRFVIGNNASCERSEELDIDFIQMSQIQVVNHTFEEYLSEYQSQASIVEGKVITAPLLTGTGCPYNCVFCQSPLDYKSRKTILCNNTKVAEYIKWLIQNYGVNHFFSLEPNLDLQNLSFLYDELEKVGLHYVSISGFVRAGDIIKIAKTGKLDYLVNKGLRVLSIGLDIPIDEDKDIYNKSFSYNEMLKCLDICYEYGIIVLSTVLGDPSIEHQHFVKQLEAIKKLKVAEVDIRLAIALRNTKYFMLNKDNLIYNPDIDCEYFDRQNYRFQTIQFPGKITPEQTYKSVNDFYNEYFHDREHLKYVEGFLIKHPITSPYFLRLYNVKNNEDIFK